MKDFTYTLITDGSSDKTLMPIINWALDQIEGIRYTPQFAEYSLKPSAGLFKRAKTAITIYECDILFIHRDSEGMLLKKRIDEIHEQIYDLGRPYIPIVPVRMTESWLLIDEQAIRSAVNNPNGKIGLQLPKLNTLEKLNDPKEILFQALRTASELPPRRLASFHPATYRHRVAELIDDFKPLRKLNAFNQFETDLRCAIGQF